MSKENFAVFRTCFPKSSDPRKDCTRPAFWGSRFPGLIFSALWAWWKPLGCHMTCMIMQRMPFPQGLVTPWSILAWITFNGHYNHILTDMTGRDMGDEALMSTAPKHWPGVAPLCPIVSGVQMNWCCARADNADNAQWEGGKRALSCSQSLGQPQPGSKKQIHRENSN